VSSAATNHPSRAARLSNSSSRPAEGMRACPRAGWRLPLVAARAGLGLGDDVNRREAEADPGRVVVWALAGPDVGRSYRELLGAAVLFQAQVATGPGGPPCSPAAPWRPPTGRCARGRVGGRVERGVALRPTAGQRRRAASQGRRAAVRSAAGARSDGPCTSSARTAAASSS
jgi:hypothetical protein